MSETTPQSGLEALSKDELQAKYKEVLGSDPASNLTKAQLIVAITAKVDIPNEPAKPDTTDEDGTGAEGSGEDSQQNAPEPGVKTPIVAAPQSGLEAKADASHVKLIRISDNTELTLPAATWANLPAGSKKQFKFQEPAEVKSLTEK